MEWPAQKEEKMGETVVPATVSDPKPLKDELYREYEFANGRIYRIYNPVALYTRPGGAGHRVLDAAGVVHYVTFPGPDGDTILRWKNREGTAPVAF